MLTEFRMKDMWCEWFLNCPNKVVDTRWHPTLGDVPVCESCARRVDAAKGEA